MCGRQVYDLPDDGSSKYFRIVSYFLPDYILQHPRSQYLCYCHDRLKSHLAFFTSLFPSKELFGLQRCIRFVRYMSVLFSVVSLLFLFLQSLFTVLFSSYFCLIIFKLFLLLAPLLLSVRGQ